jgi:predicted RNA-binding protein
VKADVLRAVFKEGTVRMTDIVGTCKDCEQTGSI